MSQFEAVTFSKAGDDRDTFILTYCQKDCFHSNFTRDFKISQEWWKSPTSQRKKSRNSHACFGGNLEKVTCLHSKIQDISSNNLTTCLVLNEQVTVK